LPPQVCISDANNWTNLPAGIGRARANSAPAHIDIKSVSPLFAAAARIGPLNAFCTG
jgi:hypothetical protein